MCRCKLATVSFALEDVPNFEFSDMSVSDSEAASTDGVYQEGSVDSDVSTLESNVSNQVMHETGDDGGVGTALNEDILAAMSNMTVGQVMDHRCLVRLCRERGLYETPHLNEVLYLQHRSFRQIENLDAYVNVATLFLNNNAITTISGLSHLKNLRMLYLNSNHLTSMSGLERNEELVYLNISNNKVSDLREIAILPKLETLIASSNQLVNISYLAIPPSLQTLDVSDNPIEGSEDDFFGYISTYGQSLLQLYCFSCPITNRLSRFRWRVIDKLPHLKYLDKQVITDDDRELAQAWSEGGREKEAAVRLLISQRKRDGMDMMVSSFRAMQLEGIQSVYSQREVVECNEMREHELVTMENQRVVEDMRRILSTIN